MNIYAAPTALYPDTWGVYVAGKLNEFGERYCVAPHLTEQQARKYVQEHQGKPLESLPTS